MLNRKTVNTTNGFTLVELAVVIVIVGILATLAINAMLNFREEAHITAVRENLSKAYMASVLYHTDYGSGTVTPDILRQYGYQQSGSITLTIVDGTSTGLRMTATHPEVRGVYQVDQNGHVSKQ